MVTSSLEFTGPSAGKSCHIAQENELPAANPRKFGILVVDDDDSVRNFLNIGLKHHGFAVWPAADGQQAVQLYQQHASEIDLVLLDVRMPGLDGPQTLAALRQLNPQVRSCFMTGQAGHYSEEELLKLGAARVFLKPFQLAEMTQFFSQLLGQAPPGSSLSVP